MSTSRRSFVMGAGVGVASHLASRPAMSANNRIRVAVLGVHGRGRDHIRGIMGQSDAEVAVLCDPDSAIAEERAASFASAYGRRPEVVADLRRVFDRKDIDAVTVATPNHWHALAAIWACQAGKDVYVEKPASHNVFEGRKLVEAAHKYNRIVQHGVQLRSSEALQEAVGLLRKGVIGNVYMGRGLVFRWRPSIGHRGQEACPSTLNYDLWTGPAGMQPFSRRYVHYNWHWNWNYGNGDVGNQGIHETDMCLWGLGLETLPANIASMGGKFLFDDDKETPEQMTSLYSWPGEKKMIQFEVRPWCTNLEEGAGVGNIFYGSEGYMVIKDYDHYAVYLGKGRSKGPSRTKGGDHFANWLKAVRSRKTSDQNAPVETAHLSSALAHLGNISYRLGRSLTFDAKTEQFTGDAEANKLLTREYRAPFVVPAVV